jgi:hypothetical protein
MNRVVYVSHFSEKLKNDFEEEILRILQKARKTNLELEDLLTKISHDERHTHFTIIQRENIMDRLYAEWSMAFKELEKNDLKQLERIYSWDDIMISAENGIEIPKDKIEEVVQSFIIK